LPDCDGVEVELGLGFGAVVGLVVAVADISVAVAPEPDIIELLYLELLFCLLEGFRQVATRDIDASCLESGVYR
jgi:hypothetical protein